VTRKNLLTAIRDALHDEMAEDERIVLLGEDVGARGGVFRLSDGWLEEFGPGRVIDTPLAESGLVGVAIGMALHGLLPVAEIQFADFIHPAYDQIVSEAARIRYRSNGDFGCPLVIRAPCGGGVHGALYHSQSIEATYAHVPGLKVVMPSTPGDAAGLLRSALRDPDPVERLGVWAQAPYPIPIRCCSSSTSARTAPSRARFPTTAPRPRSGAPT
jgi:2-oxoisovalerate dehydrogenase E1 component beta subunit